MARRPTVTTKCVADAYADKTCERIIEFGGNNGEGTGGLIAFRNCTDGTLLVSIYSVTGTVHCTIPQGKSKLEPETA